jgi:hypothetical protein
MCSFLVQVATAPVAAISTMTKDRLKKDDETRHISIRIDESKEQTRKIVKAYTQQATCSEERLDLRCSSSQSYSGILLMQRAIAGPDY